MSDVTSSSPTEIKFYEYNSTIQMFLLILGIFAIANKNTMIVVGGIFSLTVFSILINSISMRQKTVAKQGLDNVKQIIERASVQSVSLEIPSLRSLLIRNTISMVLMLVIVGGLWWMVFGLSRALIEYLEEGVIDSVDKSSIAFINMLSVAPLIFTLYLTFAVLAIIPAFVDRYVYRKESIQKAFPYVDEDGNEKPLLGRQFLRLILIIGLASMAMGGIMSLKVLLRDMNLENTPNWLAPVMVVLASTILIIPPAAWYWVTRRRIRKFHETVKQELGEDSQEWKIYEANQNSQSAQASSKQVKQIFVGLTVFLVVFSVLPILIQLMIPDQGARENAAQLTRLGLLIGGIAISFFFVNRGTGHSQDEVDTIVQALTVGDFDTAIVAADNLLTKLPSLDANFPAALAYGAAGNTERAQELLHSGVQDILKIPEEIRDKDMLSKYLGLLGALLVDIEEFEEAEVILQQAQEYQPKESVIQLSYVEMRLAQHRTEEAEKHLDKLILFDKSLPEESRRHPAKVMLFRAWIEAQRGNHDEAHRLQSEGFSIADKSDFVLMNDLYYITGNIALEQRKHNQATIAFERILKLSVRGLMADRARRMLERM